MESEVDKMVGKALSGLGVLALVALANVAVAQEAAIPEKAALSAEERIRRATVPPPGKECEQEPQDEALVELDKEHAKNLAFVSMSERMFEQALEVSEAEWRKVRDALAQKSKQDWTTWFDKKTKEGMLWTALPPCPEPGQDSKHPSGKARRGFERGLTNWVAMQFKSRPSRQGAPCPPGDPNCERASQIAGSGSGSNTGPKCQTKEEPGLDLFARVRGQLVPGRRGTHLLIASASNVPVACSVDVTINAKEGLKKQHNVTFHGPGSSGGIVYELSLGFKPDVYRDEIRLESACVPRFVWSRSRTND